MAAPIMSRYVHRSTEADALAERPVLSFCPSQPIADAEIIE